MKTHAPQPRLCEACEARAHELATTTRGQHVLKRCDHVHAAGVVIAVALVRERKIASWHLEGPLTEHESEVLAARLVASFAAAGGYEAPVVQ